MIRKATLNDTKDIAAIYNHYIENTVITFETTPVSVKEMLDRMLTISQEHPFLVYEENGRITGYCYASRWKKRDAYRHTVESTVYVAHSAHGKGIGALLMKTLIEELKKMSVHTIIACITLPNPQSTGFHEKLGFRQVSCFKETGYKFDRWIDVGDWELLL